MSNRPAHDIAANHAPATGVPASGVSATGGRDRLAITAGALRCASGISFLIAPGAANRLWGDSEVPGVTTSLLLRSMGYRDALVGGLLLRSGLRGDADVPQWFLASAGADAADLLGGIANHSRMTPDQRRRGLGGAIVGIALGMLGAVRARSRSVS